NNLERVKDWYKKIEINEQFYIQYQETEKKIEEYKTILKKIKENYESYKAAEEAIKNKKQDI
ncbi:MAG: hypothetical protein JXA99_09865, partial [Candidatus Lokiarchaeota archaeon]|nr:hypothetical protein [Candidatus Lokiarchaeota archaeon]